MLKGGTLGRTTNDVANRIKKRRTLEPGPEISFWQILCGSVIILIPPYSLSISLLQNTSQWIPYWTLSTL